MSSKRDSILAALRYELFTPRHPGLRDDAKFCREITNKIGSLLCQAQECGKQDYEFIVQQSGLRKDQAQTIIRHKRSYDYIEKDIRPLVNKWNASLDNLKTESHRLDGENVEDLSEEWIDLTNEVWRIAQEIDRKTTAVRAMDKDIFPSFVEHTHRFFSDSAKLYSESQVSDR